MDIIRFATRTCVVGGIIALFAGQLPAKEGDVLAPGHASAHERADGHRNGEAHAVGGSGAGSPDWRPYTGGHSDHVVEAHGAGGNGAEAALTMQPVPLQAGEGATLIFTLTDETGRPIEKLTTSHGRALHVVIISGDMGVLGHVHPEDFGEAIAGGKATVRFSFPRPGRYIVAADFVTEMGPSAEHFLVDVGAEAVAAPELADTPALAIATLEDGDRYAGPVMLDGTAAAGYGISLAAPKRIAAGEPATLGFTVTRNGAPVTDLRPYLDAAIHLAVVKSDLSQFLHAHGTAGGGGAEAAITGHGHASDTAHGAHPKPPHGSNSRAGFGPELTATVTFPEPGRYFLFGQAAHGAMLLVARFPVEVR